MKLKIRVERLKKFCSHLGRGFLASWRGFGEGAGSKNPVTEPKRSQNPKRPPRSSFLPNSYSIFDNALSLPVLAFALACVFLCSLQAQDQAQPPLSGIGVVLYAKGTNIVIEEILPNTSAASRLDKVHAGDRILAIAQDGGPAVPVDGTKLKQAVDMIRGPAGTSVSLTLASPVVDDGSPTRIVRFTRATLKLPPQQSVPPTP